MIVSLNPTQSRQHRSVDVGGWGLGADRLDLVVFGFVGREGEGGSEWVLEWEREWLCR